MRSPLAGLVLAGLLGAGCFSGKGAPTMRYYRLPIWLGAAPGQTRLPVVIQVEELDVEPAYDHLRLVYRISPEQLRHYRFRQWVTKPGRLVTGALRRYLRATKRFRVVTDGPRPLPNYVLRGRIEAIEQVEKGVRNARWFARIHLRLRLHRATDNRPIWRGVLNEERRVKVRKPPQVVARLTAILRSFLDRETPRLVAAIQRDRK